MIKFHCPTCHQRISALEGEIGVVGTCPECDHPIIVPPVSDVELEQEPEPTPETQPEPEVETLAEVEVVELPAEVWPNEAPGVAEAFPEPPPAEPLEANAHLESEEGEESPPGIEPASDEARPSEPVETGSPEATLPPYFEEEPPPTAAPPPEPIHPPIPTPARISPPVVPAPAINLEDLVAPDPEPAFSSKFDPTPPEAEASRGPSRKFDPSPPEPERAPPRKFDPTSEEQPPAKGKTPLQEKESAPSAPSSRKRFDPGTADELETPGPEDVEGEKSALTPTESILVALGFMAAVIMAIFSLWTEYGPYPWLASLQIQFLGKYHAQATFITTLVIWAVPILLLHRVASNGGRLARTLANGLAGSVLIGHLALSAYFLATTANTSELNSLATAAQNASFIPRKITLTPDNILLLNQRQMHELVAAAKVMTYVADGPQSPEQRRLFIPFYPSQWADERTPVLLSLTKASLESHQAKASDITGTIRRRPLPYQARIALPPSTPLFCVVMAENESVWSPWVLALLVDIYLGGFVLRNLWTHRKRAKSARQAVSPP